MVALGGDGVLASRLSEIGIKTRNINHLKRDISITEDSASLFSLFKIIREEKPDILHLHSPKAAGFGSFLGRILGVQKIIYTVHGFAWNEDRSFLQKILIAFFTWLTMIFSTKIITLSKKEYGEACMLPFIDKEKINTIYLGIDPPKFISQKSSRAFVESKYSVSEDNKVDKKIIVGTIAELHKNKGLTYAIEAMEKIVIEYPNVILFIIGEGEQRKELEELINNKNLGKNVVLSGYVENASIYLKGFSVFLLPSIKEGLPYTLIEAGYTGLPVISTIVGGIPEIISDMKSGILIQPKKPEEIVYALEFLLTHKNVQKEYGLNLQNEVKDKFNLERMLLEIEQLYK